MKRKTIDSFFKPIKKIKEPEFEQFQNCEHCNTSIYYKLKQFHDCSPQISNREHRIKELPEPIKEIMSTSQEKLYSNFHLEYKGKTENNKHIWEYLFENPDNILFQSKPHYLKLSKFDPQCIRLTFSTNHIGSPLNFYQTALLPGFSPGVLKSLLQKSIRRRLRNNSIKVSMQFACNSG